MTKSKWYWMTLLVILSLVIVACGGSDTDTGGDSGDEPDTSGEVDTTTEDDAPEPTAEPATTTDGKTRVRWFVGLGTGGNEDQIAPQEALVEAYNASQDDIELVLEIVDNAQATDILNTQIAAGNAPDIIGPVGVAGSAAFVDALLDLQPYIDADNYDLSDFDPAMVAFYESNAGQIGLPFGIFPTYISYNMDLFDEAGLEYPPSKVGDPYILNGEEVPWNHDTVAEIGRILTVDANGNDATMDEFDPENIVQFGYGVQWADIRGRLTSFGAGSFHDGNGGAVIPDHWAEGAEWYYDAMWGEQPFYPNSVYGNSDILNAGNWFESGNIAMDQTHLWYATCCLAGLEANWNIGAMPAAPDGTTTAKMHGDTFAILQGSKNPDAAWEVLKWMLGDGAAELTQIYGALPARISMQDSYFDELNQRDTFADQDINWSVVTDAMGYPDNPNHEAGYPNELVARDALATFDEQFNNNPDFDVQAGLEELRANLEGIFDGADFTPPPAEVDGATEEDGGEMEETEGAMDSDVTGTVRWFVGLGTGGNEDQIPLQEALVEEFNASQDNIELVLEIVDNAQATDILNTQIAAGNSPDIIGPVGVAGSAAFVDALLDLQPFIDAENYDLSDFDPAMVEFYASNEGQVGLPFGLFPTYISYNKDLFDEAGLEYPPSRVGDPYILDGEEVEWNHDTLAEIGRILTVDANGNDATMDGFDPENIVQFGYGVQWADIRGRLTSFGAGSFHDGNGSAVIPDHWAEAAEWYYDAMWGEQPFYPNSVYGNSDILNAGNWFESGNIAMDQTHLWYATCCLAGLEANWGIGAMPAAPDGTTTAKMHGDTFAILEGSQNPEAAWEVLKWMLGDAAAELTQIYGALPARLSLQGTYFDELNTRETFVDQDIDWSVVTDAMGYPDNPNHEAGYPNELQARDALATFDEQFNNNPDFDVQAGLEELRDNLQEIFDEAE